MASAKDSDKASRSTMPKGARGATMQKDSMYPSKGGETGGKFAHSGAKPTADKMHRPGGAAGKGGGFSNAGARSGTAHKTPLLSSKGAMAKHPGSAVGVRARKCGD